MRSPLSIAAPALVLALATAVQPAFAADAPAPAPPTAQEVQAAAARVAQDTDLGRKVHKKTLQLRPTDPSAPQRSDDSRLGWFVEFVRWLVESARFAVWLAGAAAVALLLVGLRYWIRARADAALPRRATPPSHVQSLDIRPASLPADIGAAAAALWVNGEHRAALSLVYRGALSRLVHDHQVPIRAATTEGECVQLAARRLDAARTAFFARLVRTWQLSVYGARLPDAPEALALFREFDSQLGAPRAAGAPA